MWWSDDKDVYLCDTKLCDWNDQRLGVCLIEGHCPDGFTPTESRMWESLRDWRRQDNVDNV